MIDHKKLGLKFGIEIHQRLSTHKLFCQCASDIEKQEPSSTFKRNLRAIFGELGEVDPAALFESNRKKDFTYQNLDGKSCTVEMDEEPPQPMNPEALDTSLKVALALSCNIPDEVYVMRKTVIDGSNTSGFQRTSIIGLDGHLEVDGEKILIPTVCLEEESAGIVENLPDKVTYALDRLGIPLVEIATGIIEGPPEKAKKVAEKLGMILRGTGKVQRGLGTIRQDLNVSISGGGRTEIKGVQELALIPLYIENEARRQSSLLLIRDELVKKGVKPEQMTGTVTDVTDLFSTTASSFIKKSIESGMRVLSVKLPGFDGLFKKELCPGKTLGREMADVAKARACVKGIIHTDELPAYGITEHDVAALCKQVGAGRDLVVMCVETESKAKDALAAVVDRAKAMFSGIPKEVRRALPDGGTEYMRPLPGAARMYPETDVVPIVITPNYLQSLKRSLPEDPETVIKKIASTGIAENLARELFLSGRTRLYLDALDHVPATLAASTLIETTQYLKREKADMDSIDDMRFLDLFIAVGKNRLAKEAIPDVLIELSASPQLSVQDAVTRLGITSVDKAELERIVDTIIESRKEFIKQQGERALGGLMGLVMKEARGKADGKLVNDLLQKKLKPLLRK